MGAVTTTIRVDSELKKDADELFSDLGLSFSAAVNAFLKQSVREQRIPFSLTRNKGDLRASEIEPFSSEQEAIDFATSLSLEALHATR